MKFKIGDEVKILDGYHKGKAGFVHFISGDEEIDCYGVRIKGIAGSNLHGALHTNDGQWYRVNDVKLLNKHICGIVCKCKPREAISF